MPKGVRLKPEQIVAKRREIEVKIGQGKDVLSASRLAAQDQGRKSLALELVSAHSNTTGGDAKIESTSTSTMKTN